MTLTEQGTQGRLQHAELTRRVIVAFFEVYNELGSGFLESVYRVALARVLVTQGMRADVEVPVDVFFRHEVIGRFYADLVAENRVIIEVKAVRKLAREHSYCITSVGRRWRWDCCSTSGLARSFSA
jgi:GxxExxY protein